LETTGIHAGLKQRHPCRFFALRSLCPAQTPSIGYSRHPVGHPVIFGPGVLLRKTPGNGNSRRPCRPKALDHPPCRHGFSRGRADKAQKWQNAVALGRQDVGCNQFLGFCEAKPQAQK
jgi:hypothetical protein